MTATIKIQTNAEGTYDFDLEDIAIFGEGIMEFLVSYLFNEEDGEIQLAEGLSDDSCDLREIALRESGYIVIEVDDPDGVADHFWKEKTMSFDMSGYSEVIDMLDRNKHYKPEAVAAYIEYANNWSEDGFTSSYEGEYGSDEDFAKSRELPGDVPEWVLLYFDYSAYASDLMSEYYEQNGFYFSCY